MAAAVIALIALGWFLQNFTSFKVFDGVKKFIKNDTADQSQNSPTPTPTEIKQLNVFIRNLKIVPATGALVKGATVTWYNEDSQAHTVKGDGWDSGQIPPGEKFSKTFDTAGKFPYHCAIHPTMKGEIIVQ